MKLWPFATKETDRFGFDAAVREPLHPMVERNHELARRNMELAQRNTELASLNLELTREIVRLSQRAAPVISDEDIPDPPTRSDADRSAARRPEQQQRPTPGPEHR